MVNGKLVIIPAYNEESSIIAQCEEIKSSAPDYDIVVINDRSDDLTLLKCRDKGIKVLDLPVNLGIGGAVQTGYRYARERGYETAVQVDGDGQHDPSFLNMMYETMVKEKADMVIGSRFIEGEGYQSTNLRRFGIKHFSILIKVLTGQAVTDPTSGLRMVGKRLIEDFASDYPQDYPEPESTVMVIKNGMKVVEVPVRMRERKGGRSSINLKGSVYYMIKVTLAIILERMRRR